MKRLRKKRHNVEDDNVHRWLVSYADYMTLLFALFVVLYAMAMVNEKPFESITESVGQVFKGNKEKTKKSVPGDDILIVNSNESTKNLFGDGILDETRPELLEGEQALSNVSDVKVGSDLTYLEEELRLTLFELIESGFAQLKRDGDWLEIELNSGLLFPSGSSSATNSAMQILNVIYGIIGEVTNFVRVRGYTDNQAINTEIFTSNWELSVFRATSILRELETLGVNPARMAIEGYGQYYPTADNTTVEGRAKNRKVVIAISKFGLEKSSQLTTPAISIEKVEQNTNIDESNDETDKVKVISLPNGGIRITTRNSDENGSPGDNQNDGNN